MDYSSELVSGGTDGESGGGDTTRPSSVPDIRNFDVDSVGSVVISVNSPHYHADVGREHVLAVVRVCDWVTLRNEDLKQDRHGGRPSLEPQP